MMKPKIKLDSMLLALLAAAAIGMGISYGDVYLFHILLVSTIIFYSVLLSLGRASRQHFKLPTHYHYILYFILIWFSLSITWAVNAEYAIRYVAYIVFGVTTALVVVLYAKNIAHQAKIYKLLKVIFLIEVILSILEVFTPFRLPISPFSEYVVLFGRSADEFNEITIRQLIAAATMPTGFRWNPNNLATMCTLLLPFFLFAKRRRNKLLGSGAVLVLIFSASSRGNMIAYAVVLAAYALLYGRRRAGKSLLAVAAISSLVILSGIGNDLLHRDEVQAAQQMAVAAQRYVFDDSGGYHDSIGKRRVLAEVGLSAVRDTYGWGLGAGGDKHILQQRSRILGGTESLHNFWIELLVNGGLVLTIGFWGWYIYVFAKLYKVARECSHEQIKRYAAASSLAMLGLVIAAVSPSTIVYFFPMWLLFGFAIATLNNFERYRKVNQGEQPSPQISEDKYHYS